MSNFEHKPGSVSIFKNDFKKSDNHPDYRGKGKDLDGNEIEIALWVKDGKNGKFFSGKISLPREQAQSRQQEPPQRDEFDDPIPF